MAEAVVLDDRQALVVIHGDHDIGLRQGLGRECRIGRKRPAHVEPLAAQLPYDRLDHLDLLAAEMPGFPGVRIEPEDRDARSGHAEVALEVGVHDPQRRPQPFRGDRARDIGQRQVGGHERNGQSFALQQHDRQARRASWRQGTRYVR